jgi:hypothetical protein
MSTACNKPAFRIETGLNTGHAGQIAVFFFAGGTESCFGSTDYTGIYGVCGKPISGRPRPTQRATDMQALAITRLACQRRIVLTIPANERPLKSQRDACDAQLSRGQQHDLGAPDQLLRAVPIHNHRLKADTVIRGEANGDTWAHHTDSRARSRPGIPKRTLPSGSTHSHVRPVKLQA